jgi:uncharacterized caspase-like protein
MRKALVVGINDYAAAPLKGCVNDAHRMAAALSVHGDGAPNFDVRLVTSPSTAVTRALFRESLSKLFEGQSDIALLYFSGHGYLKSTGGYVITSDAQRYDEGVSMDEILQHANQSPAKNKVVILDCCHAGAMGTPTITSGGLAQLSDGLSVLTASRDSESALEVNGSGVFTSLLVDALNGGAADIRGNITPGALYAYVDEALGAWDQRPVFKTNVSSFVPLRQLQPKVSLDILRRLTAYFPTPDSEHRLDPAYEDTSANPDPNKDKIFKELQKMQGVGLVVPVNAEFMYYAAMNSESCRLTAMGYQYWRLAKEHKM